MTEPHFPDEMGVWSEEEDIVWLPRAHYPTRAKAIAWAVREWDMLWPEVRCLSRWMVYDPWIDRLHVRSADAWSECDPATPGAFRVWRLEPNG